MEGRPNTIITINHPFSMLPTSFRSVDRIVKDRLNDPCRSKFRSIVAKKKFN